MYQLKKRIGNIISTLLKFALFICFAFPFYWMVTTAFKSYQESIAFPPTLWPHNFSWQAFVIGSTILNNVLNSPALSILADSNRSSGTCMNACRMRKIP